MRKAKKLAAIVLVLLFAVSAPLESRAATYAYDGSTVFNNFGGVVYARKASKVFKNVKNTRKNIKYIRWCLNRGMFEDDDNGIRNREVKRKKFIDDLYDMWCEPIELVHLSGGQFYGDIYGTAAGTTTIWSSSNSSNNNVLYDNSGKAYYYESSTGRYRANDGTYYDVAAYYGSSRSRSRRNSHDDAWEWALEIGIVRSNESPSTTLKYSWGYDVLEDLAYYIDNKGGYKDLGWRNTKSGNMTRFDECRLFYVFGNCDGGVYDPDDIAYYSRLR